MDTQAFVVRNGPFLTHPCKPLLPIAILLHYVDHISPPLQTNGNDLRIGYPASVPFISWRTNLLLALWLSQDRIYAAHGYPRFIGGLLTKIPFLSSHKVKSPEETLNRRIVELLSFSLNNIVKEVRFFEEVSDKWGLDIEKWEERQETRNYVAEMSRISSWGSLQDGILFLWAMEKVYLDSWTFAKSVDCSDVKSSFTSEEQALVSRALDEFVSNWTCEPFVAFIINLEELTNDLFKGKEGTECWKRAEMIWERVLELEAEFWPDLDEAGGLKE